SILLLPESIHKCTESKGPVLTLLELILALVESIPFLLKLNKNFSLCNESIRARYESIRLSTEMDFKVFRVDKIDSRTLRIDSYPSRDEVSLPGLQGIDSHPSRIDSGPKYFKN
ncbi:hypothetical protein PIB30_112396, partial [Stylosanthes scabra]|nr:hypothetical protein [Stylosanthes scabra]